MTWINFMKTSIYPNLVITGVAQESTRHMEAAIPLCLPIRPAAIAFRALVDTRITMRVSEAQPVSVGRSPISARSTEVRQLVLRPPCLARPCTLQTLHNPCLVSVLVLR